MNHHETIEACIANEAFDRPALAMWRNFPVDDHSPTSLAEETIDFQRAYYRRYPKKHKVTAIPSSDCCHKGHRYLLMAGHHPHMKPLDIRKMACREDQAGTVYEHYTVVRVPCSCEAGQMINSKTDKYDYSFDILKKFYDHSFPDRTTADEFFKSKVSDKDLIH